MAIAKVTGGVVVQIDRTTSKTAGGWIACGDDVAPGMLYSNGEFSVPAPDPRAVILRQIAELEARVTPRRAREAILTEGGRIWLEALDEEIATLRGQL